MHKRTIYGRVLISTAGEFKHFPRTLSSIDGQRREHSLKTRIGALCSGEGGEGRGRKTRRKLKGTARSGTGNFGNMLKAIISRD